MSILPTTGVSPSVEATGAIGKLDADFDMFLNLLTTQMQNQDPLDPMDTSEYTQQLVQYSQVEQSIQQTRALEDILASLSTQGMTQAANVLGREAEFDSATSGLSATAPAQWTWQAGRNVQTLSATITDANGKTVHTELLNPEKAGDYSWDGSLKTGGTAAAGGYTLALSGQDAAGNTVPITIRSIGTVNEVSSLDGEIQLGANGVTLPASTLIRLATKPAV